MKIHYDNEIEERFIPLSYEEILKGYLKYFEPLDEEKYQALGAKIDWYYYQQFYEIQEVLKRNYNPFNPDRDTFSSPLSSEILAEKEEAFLEKVLVLLNDANYEVLTKVRLEEVMNRTSPYGVQVSVNFEDFEDIRLYFRGVSIQEEEIKDPKKFYLKKKIVRESIYRRLFIVVKPKLCKDITSPVLYVKLFKDIPQTDLDMLFPNTTVKMTLFDKLKLGVLGGGGTVGGGTTLITKLSVAAIEPLSAFIALGAFVGVLWRQIKEVLFRRTHYMAQLAKHLYFHNLSNNAGAVNHLVQMARAEESKEVLLVYLFLHHQNQPITIEELDKEIELYIFKYYAMKIDFEIEDALKKLRKLGFLREENGWVSVWEIDEVLDFFTHRNNIDL